MFYFVPSWYSEQRAFDNNTIVWFLHQPNMLMDDITSLFKLFQRVDQPSTLLILGYMPHLRYYLHELDLLEQSYISIFDRLQDISEVTPKMVNFESLEWPKNTQFVYSQFLILARQNGKKFAEINFGNDGQLIWIDYFAKEVIERRFVIDDRGFLSSIIYFDHEGQELYQDYLNVEGIWQFRQYLQENHRIEVNPLVSSRFKKSSYDSLYQLLEEFTIALFEEKVKPSDSFVLAYDETHNDLILQHKGQRELIVSFFQKRPTPSDDQLVVALKEANLALTDTVSEYNRLSAYNQCPVANVSPYDARLSLGKSQRLKELIIYLLVDKLSFTDLDKIINETFDVMLTNENIQLLLVSYRTDYPFKSELEAFVEKKQEDWKRRQGHVFLDDFEEEYEKEIQSAGQTVLQQSQEAPRLLLTFLTNENALLNQLDKARLIVDLSEDPDLYTQIAGISAGIPQINMVATDYVESFKNGYIIHSLSELKEAYDYYLLTLRNWNESLVYSVSKIGEYTSGSVVKKIMTLLRDNQNG